MKIAGTLVILCVISCQVCVAQNAELVFSTGHDRRVQSAAFSPDGSMAATGDEGSDNNIILWDIKTGREIATFRANDADNIAFSSDGRILAASGSSLGIDMWDLNKGEQIRFKGDIWTIHSFAFTSDSRFVALANYSAGYVYHDIQFHSVETGKLVQKFYGKIRTVYEMEMSPADSILATSWRVEKGRIVELWNPWTGELIKTLNVGMYLKFTPDGKMLIVTSEEDGTNIYKMPEIELIYSGPYIGWPIGFTNEGEMVISGYRDRIEVNFFNLSDMKVTGIVPIESYAIWGYDPNNNHLITKERESKIFELSDAGTGKILYSFGQTCAACGKANEAADILLNSYDHSLAIQTRDSTYRIFSFDINELSKADALPENWMTPVIPLTKEQEEYLGMDEEDEMEPIDSYRVSHDGKYLAYSQWNDIYLVPSDSTGFSRSFPSSSMWLNCVFSPESKRLGVLNEYDITFYDIETKKPLGTFVSLGDTDWVFVTPEGLYDGTPEGIKYPHWVENKQAVLLEDSEKSKFVPGLFKRVFIGE